MRPFAEKVVRKLLRKLDGPQFQEIIVMVAHELEERTIEKRVAGYHKEYEQRKVDRAEAILREVFKD